MNKLFNPKSIAIIGASRHKDKIGYQILDNLISSGYKGRIFPVNPEANKILDLQCYKSINSFSDEVDIALIVVPAVDVIEILKDCVNKKIPFVVIISSGFSEIGPDGKKLQEEINNIIKNTLTRVIGPNCLGVINTFANINLTFAASSLTKGNVSAVFQSGALGVVSLDLAQKYGFGISKFISLGNKTDIEESELIQYLANDPETKIIALYVENLTNPKKFFEIARNASKNKPIVILKGGRSKEGAKAAFSHTAAMITEDRINNAIFTQSNLIVVNTIDEMLSVISILSSEPEMKNNNLAIITNAGGVGIIATDIASEEKLNLPKPSVSDLKNPLDLTGTALAEDYENALKKVISDKKYSAVIVILTPQTVTEIEKTAMLISKYSESKKVIITSFLGDKTVEKAINIFRKNNVPHFEDPEEGVVAISKIYKYYQRKLKNNNIIDFDSNIIDKKYDNIFELVKNYNIPIAKYGVAMNVAQGKDIYNSINAPVAVKNISEKIVHKYKAGKVVLNVDGIDALEKAMKKVGFPSLIQKMENLPIEIIIGARRDNNFGIIVTFGEGGIYTEEVSDISTKIMPLTKNDLDEMIKETKINQILLKEKIDYNQIKQIILCICQIMIDFPDISEIELNPVKISHNCAICVDARIKKIIAQ